MIDLKSLINKKIVASILSESGLDSGLDFIYTDPKLKEILYAILKPVNKEKIQNIPADQIKKGITVEGEHTTHPAVAKIIALHHLLEDPHYYDKLDAAGLADELAEGYGEGTPSKDPCMKKGSRWTNSIYKLNKKTPRLP